MLYAPSATWSGPRFHGQGSCIARVAALQSALGKVDFSHGSRVVPCTPGSALTTPPVFGDSIRLRRSKIFTLFDAILTNRFTSES